MISETLYPWIVFPFKVLSMLSVLSGKETQRNKAGNNNMKLEKIDLATGSDNCQHDLVSRITLR